MGLVCSIYPLFAQDAAANAASVIPEAARKHFVMGTALFKDAKTAEDYAQVTGEFKQAAELAPQWPEARYNLALSKEAAGDYAGARSDLWAYQSFKLSDAEARAVQDKLYAIEAKLAKANSPEGYRQKLENEALENGCVQAQATYPDLIKKLDGVIFRGDGDWLRGYRIQFVKKPTSISGFKEYPQTSFLWYQIIHEDKTVEGGIIYSPDFVIPTGKLTFKGHRNDHDGSFILSQDGQTLIQRGKISTINTLMDDDVWHRAN